MAFEPTSTAHKKRIRQAKKKTHYSPKFLAIYVCVCVLYRLDVGQSEMALPGERAIARTLCCRNEIAFSIERIGQGWR